MKLIPTPRRVDPDDTIGQGMDLTLTVALFLGFGFLLDRWLDTTPLFMVVLSTVAAVGAFIGLKYRYTARMERLDAQRISASSATAERDLR
ncbi:MAG: AtpZ/AtpI family protein [Actinomycetota bacterium]|nr:AtpZ/AtpI family protein [Actinomycetota bacterium]